MQDGKSWKTTVGGVAALLAALGLLGNMIAGNAEFSMENISIVMTAFGAAWGLFKAKDSNVHGAGDSATTVHSK